MSEIDKLTNDVKLIQNDEKIKENIISNELVESRAEEVIWKTIITFPNYEISNYNNILQIRKIISKEIIKINKDNTISLRRDDDNQSIKIRIEILIERYFDIRIWKEIVDFPNYEITNNNIVQVRRKSNQKINKINEKYNTLSLVNEQGRKSFNINSLIHICFNESIQIWKNIDENENYEISNDINIGFQIRNKKTKKVLRGGKDGCVHLRGKIEKINADCNSNFSIIRLKRKYYPENLPGEFWKDILGYEELYKVSNEGRIKNMRNFNILINIEPIKGSYLRTTLSVNNIDKVYSTHRLVALTFLDKPEGKNIVNHLNGVKNDPRLINLEWVTSRENNQHAHDNKLVNTYKRAVYQIDHETNIIIEEFESAREAERITEISHQNIAKVCNDDLISTGGYKWRYVNPDRKGRTEEEKKDLENEIWKNCKEEGYVVSSEGRIKNIRTNNIIQTAIYAKREKVTLNSNTYLVHRLVALAFIPNPNNLKEVDHINNESLVNKATNLQWLSSEDNHRKSNAKPIEQLDLEGNFIKKWNAITDAEISLKITHGAISLCCRKEIDEAGGYKWEFVNKEDN
jgi:hypothetical protein